METLDVINPEHLQRLLAQAGARPEHDLGQHFLVCERVRSATLSALASGPRAVTELGAGAGPLTIALLKAGYTVRAVERDSALTKVLASQVPPEAQSRFEIQAADLRSVDWRWATPYQVVGNIPYNLSGLILRRLTQLDPAPGQAVLLLQQEVGERLRAQPPHMQLLGVVIQLWGTVTRLLSVPPSCFWPQPQVRSELVLLTPHAAPLPLAARERVVGLAKILFQQRRKQIGGVLHSHFHIERREVTQRLAAISLTPTQRPQELSLTDWQQLATAFLSPAQ